MQCKTREKRKEKKRVRLTVGGVKIDYPSEVDTPTADMLVPKILFSGIISTKGARFMTIDISNFYLMTVLKRPQYIRINVRDISDEIIK